MKTTVVIRQIPVAQPRPKVTKWATFDPAKDKKTWAKVQIAEQIPKKIDVPCQIVVIFYLPIPKSISKTKQRKMLLNEIKHTKKPDLDNYIKYFLDVLNDVGLQDDSLVWQIMATKLYSNDPRTEADIL